MSLLDAGLVDDLAPASAAGSPSPTGPSGGEPAKPSAGKAPTKKPAAKKAAGRVDKAPSRGPGRPPRHNLAGRLEQSITSMGMGVALLSPADGACIIKGSNGLAGSLDKLAAENPKVQATLERWLTAGAWSGVFMATLPITVGIMANHGLIPEDLALLFALATEADDGDT